MLLEQARVNSKQQQKLNKTWGHLQSTMGTITLQHAYHGLRL
jgi:hypothetical protein